MSDPLSGQDWASDLLAEEGMALQGSDWAQDLLSEPQPSPPPPEQAPPVVDPVQQGLPTEQAGEVLGLDEPDPGLIESALRSLTEKSSSAPTIWGMPNLVNAARHVARGGLNVASSLASSAEQAAASPPAILASGEPDGLIEQFAPGFRESARSLSGLADAITSEKERRGILERAQEEGARSLPSSISQAVLEQAPQIALGAVAGPAPLILQESGSHYQGLVDQGVDPETANQHAALYGAVSGLLEYLPIKRLVEKAGVPSQGVAARLMDAGTQALAEGGTEGAQSFVGQLDELYLTGEKVDAGEIAEETLVGTIVGVLTGGLAGGGAVNQKRPPVAEDAPQALAQPDPEKMAQALGQAEPSQEAAPPMAVEESYSYQGERFSPRMGPQDRMLVAKDESGQEMGYVWYSKEKDGDWSVRRVETDPKFRRQGVASELYRQVAAQEGGSYTGSTARSSEGEALVESLRGREPQIFQQETTDVQEDQVLDEAEGLQAQRQPQLGRPDPESPFADPGRGFEAREQPLGEQDRQAGQVLLGREGEGGFIARPEGVARDLKIWADRWFRSRGNWTPSAFRLKLDKDHALGAHSKGLEYRLRELDKGIREYDGPLTPTQLTRYLGDALRGNTAVNLSAETSTLDETQVERIARNLAERRGLEEPGPAELEVARLEAERVADRGVAPGALTPELASTVGKMRADIDGFTRALRREGLLDDSAARDLERRYGLYTHRSYEAFSEKSPQRYLDRVEAEPLWNRAADIFSQEHHELSREEVEGAMRKLIERGKSYMPGGVPEGAKNRSTLFRRQDLRDIGRLLLGERRDIRSQAADTIIGQAGLLEHHRFLTALREDGLGHYLYEKPRGRFYRPIDEESVAVPVLDPEGQPGLIYQTKGKKRTDPVSGLHASPEFLRELEEAGPNQKEMSSWLRVYMAVNFATKANLTVGSPQTQSRNVQSNFLPAMAAGYLPTGKGGKEAIDLVVRDLLHSSAPEVREKLMKYRKLGILDQGADYGDLRRMGQFADVLRVEINPGGKLAAATRATLRKATQAYAHGDNLWKILGWHKERARLEKAYPEMSPEKLDKEAALIVRETLQNYSELPRFAKAVSANPVAAPFFSFTWAMARGLKNTALRAAKEVRSNNPVIRRVGMQRLAGLMVALSLPEASAFALRWISNTDGDDEDALREFVPAWDRGATLGIVHHKPGEYTYFNWGFMDYFSKLKEPVRLAYFAATTDRDIGDLSEEFLSDFGEEILAGSLVDAVRGQTMDGQRVWLRKDSLSTKLEKSALHLWDTGRPGVARNAENIYDASTDKVSRSGFSRRLWQEMVALAGPRIQTIDVRQALGFYGRRFRREIAESTQVYTLEANSRGTVSEHDLVQGYKRANKARFQVLRDLRRKIEAGVTSGLSLDETLEALNVPEKYVDMAMYGDPEPLDYRRGDHWEDAEDALEESIGDLE